MANLQQCQNGHYYDSSIHPSCPYCSSASTGTDRTAGAVVTNYDFATAPPKNVFGKVENLTPDRDITAPPRGVGFRGADNNSGTFNHDGLTLPPVTPVDYDGGTRPIRPPVSGKTGIESGQQDDAKWLVVGWLVAVEGPYRGKSFEIHHGNTYIGREEGDIVLKKDRAVSSSKNANTVYEERKNRYLLVAGQSTNLVYVDNELLPNSSHVELKPYSSIEIGESKFLFIPFCTEKFKWSDQNA